MANGPIVLVIGAAGGIGSALCELHAGDVARVIAFLLDPVSTWITGQVYGVDGGLATARAR